MPSMETLNTWADVWAGFMWDRTVDSVVVLAIVGVLWLLIHRRSSPQFGYCLFLLVLVKAVVPIEVTVPSWMTYLSPEGVVDRSTEWAGTFTPWREFEDTRGAFQPPVEGRSAEVEQQPLVSEQAVALPVSEKGTTVADTSSTWSAMTLLMVGWAFVVLFLLIRFVWIQWRISRMVAQATPVDPAVLPVDWRELRRMAGVRQHVQLVASPAVSSPTVWGFAKPRLIVPSDFLQSLTPAQIKWILLHELAHIRRIDLLAAAFQKLVQILYFYNPVIWLTNWVLDQLREYACDDAALASCREPREDCGEGFLSVIRHANHLPDFTTTPLGLFNSTTLIRRRMMRILDGKRKLQVGFSVRRMAILLFVSLLVLPSIRSEKQGVPLAAAETSGSNTGIVNGQTQPSSPIQRMRRVDVPEGLTLSNLSPDGRYFAGFTEQDQLVVLDTHTGALDKIDDSAWPSNALWSADGHQIAYLYSDSWTSFSIRVANLQTGKKETLLELKDYYCDLQDWSSDGRYILAIEHWRSKRHDTPVILLIDMREKTIKPIEIDEAFPNENRNWTPPIHPRFSPDGQWIAYRTQEPEIALQIRSLDGTVHERYSGFSTWIVEPSWAPDGKSILFRDYNNPNDYSQLCAVQVDQGHFVGEPRVVVPDFGKGKVRIVTYTQNGHLAYSPEVLPYALYTVRLSLETCTAVEEPQLTIDEGTRYHAWAPDASTIAQCGGNQIRFWNLEKKVVDTSTLSRFFVDSVPILWHPSGSFLIGAGKDKDGQQGIFKVDLDSGEVEYLFTQSEEADQSRRLAMSADGNTIAELSEKGVVHVFTLEDMERTPVVQTNKEAGQFVTAVTMSPDGGQIAYLQNERPWNREQGISKAPPRQRILVTSINGEKTTELLDFPVEFKDEGYHKLIVDIGWSPNGKFIVYSVSNDGLWAAPVSGKPPVRIAVPKNLRFTWLSLVQWSPDGEHLSFVAVPEQRPQYWIIENFTVPANMTAQARDASEPSTRQHLEPAQVSLIRYPVSGDSEEPSVDEEDTPDSKEDGVPYQIVSEGLQLDSPLYTDSALKFVEIPEEYKGLPSLLP